MIDDTSVRILDNEGLRVSDVAADLYRPVLSAQRMINIAESQVRQMEEREAELLQAIANGEDETRNLLYVQSGLATERHGRDQLVACQTQIMEAALWRSTKYFKNNLEVFKFMAEQDSRDAIERRSPIRTADNGETISDWDVLNRPPLDSV